MDTPTAPTHKDLDEDDFSDDPDAVWDFEQVSRKTTPWKYGTNEAIVFKRLSDGTFWRACFCRSSDGETHGLRDNDVEILRVYPHQVMSTVYRVAPATAAE